MKLTSSNFYPKSGQIILTNEIDDSYFTLIENTISNNNNFKTDYENEFESSQFNKTAKVVLADEKDVVHTTTLLDYYNTNLQGFTKELFTKDDNESIRYLYLEKKTFETTHNHKVEILNKYHGVFNQGFATKNTRLKANKKITVKDNTLTKAYPFILAEGMDFTKIELYMVARCFYIPMEKNILNDRMAIYKYPEWFMNRQDLIDAVENTIYINGNLKTKENADGTTEVITEFYGTEEDTSSVFGNAPADYNTTLGNINILNFHKRHGEYYPKQQTQQTT